MNKGLTLIEMLISLTILGIILVALSGLYGAAGRNYLREGQKGQMQRNLNFAADDIGKQIKIASAGLPTQAAYNRTQNPDNILILTIPATDGNNNFLYSGANLLTDNFVYYLSGGNLHKKIFATPTGQRTQYDQKDVIILNNVNTFLCTYAPNPAPKEISCTINLKKNISGRDIEVSATKTANLRNIQ